jgi:hypothetical protein
MSRSVQGPDVCFRKLKSSAAGNGGTMLIVCRKPGQDLEFTYSDVLQIADEAGSERTTARVPNGSGGETECDFDKSDLFGNVTLS